MQSRDGRMRTDGFRLPKAALYQAELRPAARECRGRTRRAGLAEPPVPAPKQGHGLAGLGDAVDLELGRADHEVGVDRRVVDAALAPLLRRQRRRPLDRI